MILWAASSRGLFHTIPHKTTPDQAGVISVVAMAICQYADEDRYYLFKCDKDWMVVFDWDAESVEAAKMIAASHVPDEAITWQPQS